MSSASEQKQHHLAFLALLDEATRLRESTEDVADEVREAQEIRDLREIVRDTVMPQQVYFTLSSSRSGR